MRIEQQIEQALREERSKQLHHGHEWDVADAMAAIMPTLTEVERVYVDGIAAVLDAHVGSATLFCRACDWTPVEWPGWRDEDETVLLHRHQAEAIAAYLRGSR